MNKEKYPKWTISILLVIKAKEKKFNIFAAVLPDNKITLFLISLVNKVLTSTIFDHYVNSFEMWYAIGKNKPRTKPQKIIISIDKFGLSGSKGPSIILKLFPTSDISTLFISMLLVITR